VDNLVKFLKGSPLFILSTQLLFSAAFVGYFVGSDYSIFHFITFIVMYALTMGIGVVMFLHRYFSHNSFEPHPAVYWIGLLFTIIASRGSPIGWAAVHRAHHRKTDVEGDPHSPHLFGWKVLFPPLLKFEDNKGVNSPQFVRDLIVREELMFVDKYYKLVWLGVFAVLFIVLPIDYFFLSLLPAVAMVGWVFNCTTYTLHGGSVGARNGLIENILMIGDGLHKVHHERAASHCTSQDPLKDPVGWLIRQTALSYRV
jgi:fatty-acid desaturase